MGESIQNTSSYGTFSSQESPVTDERASQKALLKESDRSVMHHLIGAIALTLILGSFAAFNGGNSIVGINALITIGGASLILAKLGLACGDYVYREKDKGIFGIEEESLETTTTLLEYVALEEAKFHAHLELAMGRDAEIPSLRASRALNPLTPEQAKKLNTATILICSAAVILTLEAFVFCPHTAPLVTTATLVGTGLVLTGVLNHYRKSPERNPDVNIENLRETLENDLPSSNEVD